MQGPKETSGGLDQWAPADLELLSNDACGHLATFFDVIEEGGACPKGLSIARSAFLAKEEDSGMNPVDYSVLLMLPSV